MNKIIEDLNWRYATKKFDTTKKVSNEDLETIKESLRLVASSFGLQPLKYIIIENQELKNKLIPSSYGQMQVADCSYVIVICSTTDVQDIDVDLYMQTIEKVRETPIDMLEQFGQYIKGYIANMTKEQKSNWTTRQAYIALGQLLSTCAQLRIDSTPMEGFDPSAYNEVLGLSEKGLEATLVCPIGYRSEEDTAQHNKKVRKDSEDLFELL